MRIRLLENVKKIELSAEKHQQATLSSLITPDARSLTTGARTSYAIANLQRYCQEEQIEICNDTASLLSIILCAALESIKPDHARNMLLGKDQE